MIAERRNNGGKKERIKIKTGTILKILEKLSARIKVALEIVTITRLGNALTRKLQT